jgi:hypothetical protein
MKNHSRIAPGEAVYNGRNKSRTERCSAADPHFARRWVGEELDIPDALAQLVKRSMAAIEYRAALFGELDPAGVSNERLTPRAYSRSLIERETTG